MQLITSGNPNLNTVRSVVYFANKKFDGKIKKVIFIDNEDSLYVKGQSIESERNDLVRQYIPTVRIESLMLDQQGLHIEIPRIVSEQLKIYRDDDIIVDLTNGTKLVSNILYASASLSRISNLFFLFVSRDKHSEPPENYNKDDYRIDTLSPLQNLDSIGRYIFFEIYYYRDALDDVLDKLKDVKFDSSFLDNESLRSKLNGAISHYFLESYSEAIMNVGQIVEELSLELAKKIKNLAKGLIRVKVPLDFNGSIDWLRVQFCEPLRVKRGVGLEGYEESLKELQNIDKIIDLIRVYRNLSSHPYDLLRDKGDARLILSNTIYLLELVGRTKVLR